MTNYVPEKELFILVFFFGLMNGVRDGTRLGLDFGNNLRRASCDV